MTPEYLKELAAAADPDELWRLPLFDHLDLPADKRRQLDAGVALRRHAAHLERVNALIGTAKSLVITPLSHNATATMTIATPANHKKLIKAHDA